MGRYPEIDLQRLERVDIDARPSKVSLEMQASPPPRPESFAEFWDGLPRTLAADDLRTLARATV